MHSGLLQSAAALDLLGRMHEVRAQNLANANTAGYRRRIAAAAGVVRIDDVVVQERCGVDQFEGNREVDHIGGVLASARAKGEQRDGRPDTLATGVDQVVGNLRQPRFT